LIAVVSGGHLWADRFDGNLEDIFELQDQITSKVVAAIEPRVEQAEIEAANRKSTSHLGAYDYFLRGMASFYEATREGIDKALQLYLRAIELDPSFATAYGWATICYARRKQAFWMADVDSESEQGMRLARKAIELGRDDAFAIGAGGFGLATLGGEVDAGLTQIDRALALNPNLANAWHGSGWMRAYAGDPETAIKHLGEAMRLSPLDPQTSQLSMAMALAM
jgi:tetratricopeptide (TPR) repeat protein